MQSDTVTMLEDLDSIHRLHHQTMMGFIADYIYRESRYGTHFSVVLVYSQEKLDLQISMLEKLLRRTDRFISLQEKLICVVFDAVDYNSYLKAAENLYETLQSTNCHQTYFITTALSNEFQENFVNMFNHLFERLHYSIEHKLYGIVNSEDYII